MDDTVKLPLNVHLLFTSQSETIQSECMSNIGKNRLERTYSFTVYESPEPLITAINALFTLKKCNIGA